MNRKEKIEYLKRIRQGEKVKLGKLLFACCTPEPGIYEVNGKLLTKEQVKRLSERYEVTLYWREKLAE